MKALRHTREALYFLIIVAVMFKLMEWWLWPLVPFILGAFVILFLIGVVFTRSLH